MLKYAPPLNKCNAHTQFKEMERMLEMGYTPSEVYPHAKLKNTVADVIGASLNKRY